MNDQLLLGQLNVASEHPLLTLCFLVGGLLVTLGTVVMVVTPIIQLSKRVERHALNLAALGAMIGAPAVIPIVFSGIDIYSAPVLKAALVCMPLVAIACSFFIATTIETEHRESIKRQN